MRIVLGGYIVGYPLGGMTWHHLNYVCGLLELGHDVTFFEDGANHPAYDPVAQTYGDPTYGVSYLRETFAAYGLTIPWHYRFGEFSAGLSVCEAAERLKTADLFIAVSGVTPVEWYDLPRRTLVIDTDPVFTQLKMRDNATLRDYYARFSHQATFGRLIGTEFCPLPTHGFEWIPTQQPIALSRWETSDAPAGGCLTTVGKWSHAREREVEFAGQRYASDKRRMYDRLVDLPRHCPMPIEMRMDGLDEKSRERFARGGWRFGDPIAASSSCIGYQRYLAASAGELTVAKEIYVGVPSGWFSDRSAAFLASGRPVVTQATGFEDWLPTGEGLFSFGQFDEAVDAVHVIYADPARHGRAARAIAERHFDARTVLSALIDRVA